MTKFSHPGFRLVDLVNRRSGIRTAPGPEGPIGRHDRGLPPLESSTPILPSNPLNLLPVRNLLPRV